MQLHSMDKELVEIYNIRNLESIKVSDLVLHSSGKTLIIPTILIIYDGFKMLHLSARDKYFDIFVKKVVEVYRDEKNNILEDFLTDPFRLHSKIDCDSHSASILEEGNLADTKEFYKFYRDKDAYDGSLLFQNNEVKRLIAIVKYHIEQIFSMTNHIINIDKEVSGYRDNYLLSGRLDGIEKIFPFSFNKINSKEYLFSVGGVYKDAVATDVDIRFEKDGIYVVTKVGKDLISSTEYKIVNGAVKVINTVKKEDIIFSYYNKDLECVISDELDNLKSLDYADNLNWYRLPWNALYGTKVSIENISETEKIIGIANKLIDGDEEGFIIREYQTTSYKRNSTSSVEAESLVLDEASKTVLGSAIDTENKLFIIETGFDDTTRDYYTNSKYFYHAAYSKDGVKGIKTENLKPLGHKQEIINPGDLRNKQKIKTIAEGEKI